VPQDARLRHYDSIDMEQAQIVRILEMLEKSLWTLNFIASAFVIWRLYSLELQKTYRYFFAGMALAVIRSAMLFTFGPKTEVYYRIWIATQPLLWLSYFLIVFELYSLALRRYPGIYSLSRLFFFGAVATAAIISALTILPTIAAAPARYPLIYYYALIERGVATSLAIFLLLLLLLVTWFTVPLSRNLLTHCVVYSVYFLVNNVTLLHRHLGGAHASYVSSVFKLIVALGCYFCWAFLLSRSGEDRTASLHLGRSPLEEKRLLGQLEGLNATLLRTARK
jgi:hypothetical protein